MTEQNKGKKQRAPRSKRAEMIEKTRAKLEKLLAQEAGTYVDDSMEKRIERRLRETRRELKSANTILVGVTKKDGKGWVTSPIAEKIEKTEARLASQIETQKRATAYAQKLPKDVEKLEAALEVAKLGQEVDFPADLTPLSKDQERTDEEHESHATVTAD